MKSKIGEILCLLLFVVATSWAGQDSDRWWPTQAIPKGLVRAVYRDGSTVAASGPMQMLENIKKIAPVKRPAFINITGYCWGYNATWVMDLKQKLSPNYVLVSTDDLAHLFRESQNTAGK